ncbi:MAG: hypothetical protein R3B09_13895 [Nannocystaceae bacterium]
MSLVKSIVLTSALTSTLALASGTAHAGDCRSDFQIAGDLWQKYGDEIKRIAAEVGASITGAGVDEIRSKLDHAEAAIARAQAKANETFKNGKFKIGPRALPIGEALRGDLMTERVFLTPGPAVDDALKIVLRGEGGGAKSDVNVTICATDQRGQTVKVHDFTFTSGDYTKTFERTVQGAKDRVISVHLDRKKWGVNAYKYSLQATR